MKISQFIKTFLMFIPLVTWTVGNAGLAAKSSISKPNNSKSTTVIPNGFEVQYCPEKEKLVKTNMIWTAEDKWKSHDESFAEKISEFLGAQWTGINLGTILCIYGDQAVVDFPVALEPIYVMLALEPQNDNWSVNIKGYRFCHSTNTQDCGFMVQQPKKQGPLYDDIKYHPTRPKSE